MAETPQKIGAAPGRLGRRRTREARPHRSYRVRPLLWISLVILAFFLVAALWPNLLAPGDPLATDPLTGMSAPSGAHILGTDESGRDIYTRIIHGTSASLLMGLAATAIGMGLGLILGTAAALGPRWLDEAIARVLEVGFAFPGILLALLVIAVWGPGVLTTTIAVGLSSAPGYARILRSTMLAVRTSPYVEQDIIMGRSWWHRLVHTVVPNTVAPLFSMATLGLGQSIIWASALSFLGLGTPPPSPEWGAMLSAGRDYLLTGAWWLTLCPGLAILIVALAATGLGRSIQARTRTAGGAA
ncbi:ABC transporter permease [Neoactinobaculum massilliense]|uniref:ABC transporter permease n=1 Tax=Neoactinobaculum massilliense TaxID=2364794 RepID=UPI001F14B158|nr:ABC transporter permease [Neoactinobaculum massilliense]